MKRTRLEDVGPCPVHDRSCAAIPQAPIALFTSPERVNGIAVSPVVLEVTVSFSCDGERRPPMVDSVAAFAVRAEPRLEFGRGETLPLDTRPAKRLKCGLCRAVRAVQRPAGASPPAARRTVLVHRREVDRTCRGVKPHRRVCHGERDPLVPGARKVDAGIYHRGETHSVQLDDAAVRGARHVHPYADRAARGCAVRVEHVDIVATADDWQPGQRRRGLEAQDVVRMPQRVRSDSDVVLLPWRQSHPFVAYDVHTAVDAQHFASTHAPG